MTANPIVTALDLADYQGGDAQSLIDQATAQVRRYCGWHVTPEVTETLTLDASGSSTIMLPTLHVASVDSVAFNGTALTAVDDFVWSPVGYVSFKGDGPFFSETPWCAGVGAVVVTLTHGYAEALDLASVIMSRATRMKATPGSAFRWQIGPFSEQYETASGFTLDELSILDHYRLPPRP